jgi:hypothetical protein
MFLEIVHLANVIVNFFFFFYIYTRSFSLYHKNKSRTKLVILILSFSGDYWRRRVDLQRIGHEVGLIANRRERENDRRLPRKQR